MTRGSGVLPRRLQAPSWWLPGCVTTAVPPAGSGGTGRRWRVRARRYRKSREGGRTGGVTGSSRSAVRLMTPSCFSSRPRTSSAGLVRATLR
jgi:hypothetical protein